MTPGGSQWNASVDAQWNAVSHPHNVPPKQVPNGAGDIYFATIDYQFRRGKGKDSKDASGWDPVKWAYSEAEASRHAREYNEPYAIYFCSEFTAILAGEGYVAYMRFRNANAGQMPLLTVMDYTAVLEQFRYAGISLFVKVPDDREHAALFNRYDCAPGTLLMCAPDGSKLAVFAGNNCNALSVGEFLANDYDKKMGTWQDENRKDADQWRRLQKARRICAGLLVTLDDSRLQHLVCFGRKIVTGDSPAGDAAFQALKDLGVRTIIRVDGQPPETERADKLGMTSVHLPLSFSGITQGQAQALAKAVRDLPGPVYIHGISSDRRAAAAAAVASVVLGDFTPEQAEAALAVSGVPANRDNGLYASIKSLTSLPLEKLGDVEFNFSAKSSVSRLTAAMVQIQKTWSRIEEAQKLRWKIPDARKDLNVGADSLELIDRCVAAGSMDSVKNLPRASERLLETRTALTQLQRQWQSGHAGAAEIDKLDAAYQRATGSCVACHEEYRDRMK